MPSLKDVAAFAGVSFSTVSRVMANKSYVKSATREKVLAAAKTLDYVPNTLARSLKEGRTNTIGVMVPSIENMVFPAIVRGIEDVCHKNGVMVVLCNTDENIETEKAYIKKLKTHWVDGFIVAAITAESGHIYQLRKEEFPVVLACRHYNKKIDAVVSDNEEAAFKAVQHLVRCGYKKIAFAMGRQDIAIYQDRFKGYSRALQKAGIAYNPGLVMHELNGNESFYALTKALVQAEERPDAIFASSDPKAFYIMRALQDMALKIPEDIGLVGFDNVSISALMQPPLTTVAQNLYEIGAQAAMRLLHQINFKHKNGKLDKPLIKKLKAGLVIRKSTKEKRNF